MQSQLTTVNRGWLKKMVEKGLVEAKCNYHYTDDYAWDDAVGFEKEKTFKPVRVRKPRVSMETGRFDNDWKEGFVNLDEHDFRTKSGCCYRDEEGTITLHVHSNLCYELRIRWINE